MALRVVARHHGEGIASHCATDEYPLPDDNHGVLERLAATAQLTA
jgi:hypothetical protein